VKGSWSTVDHEPFIPITRWIIWDPISSCLNVSTVCVRWQWQAAFLVCREGMIGV